MDENATTAGLVDNRYGTITLPSNGVPISDTTITIDTPTVQFQDGNYTDSLGLHHWRRFDLISARGNASTKEASGRSSNISRRAPKKVRCIIQRM